MHGDWKKRIQGKKAKQEGQYFENLVDRSVNKEGGFVVTIPSGYRQVRSGSKQIFLRIPTAFDKVLCFSKQKTVFVDCKTFDSDRITFSQIKPHQISALFQLETRGHVAGYLIHFRKVDKIGFFPASYLVELKPGQSRVFTDAQIIGTSLNFSLLSLFKE